MSAPLSEYYTVEYHFLGDCFSVRSLPEYLTDAQQSFHEGRFFVSIVLALHPTQAGADDECEVWKARRDSSPVTLKQRLEQLRPHIEGLESSLSDAERRGS